MIRPIKRHGAALILLAPALPAFAQPTAASSPASQAEPIKVPADPTWLVADVGIALIVGLIVGYAVGAWRSAARHRASHA